MPTKPVIDFTLLYQVITIIVLTLILLGILQLMQRGVERRMLAKYLDTEKISRLKTLIHGIRSILNVVIFFLALMTLLLVMGINILPLLAGAGVVGLALSLGAQTLIKDFLGGILLLVENQVKVGDHIKVLGVSGQVEDINLRTIELRDFDGQLHIIPNGDIRLLSNKSRDWSRAIVEIKVRQDFDLSAVLPVVNQALLNAAQDSAIKSYLLEMPELVSCVGNQDQHVIMRLQVKTQPGKQLEVERRIREYAMEGLREINAM
ncbi:MAG TPA: mechanosensitive ion channel family protein [Anaerolineaceae bacterium]